MTWEGRNFSVSDTIRIMVLGNPIDYTVNIQGTISPGMERLETASFWLVISQADAQGNPVQIHEEFAVENIPIETNQQGEPKIPRPGDTFVYRLSQEQLQQSRDSVTHVAYRVDRTGTDRDLTGVPNWSGIKAAFPLVITFEP
jgi:hypothetical protein